MKQVWFKKKGWVYVPVNAAGLLITGSAVLFMVPVIIAAVRTSHSGTDALYEIFIYATCTAFWWKWVAEKTSD